MCTFVVSPRGVITKNQNNLKHKNNSMMKQSISKLTALTVLLVALGMAFVSCSDEKSVGDKLSYYSDDTPVITVVNLEKCLEASGITREDDGEITAPKALKDLVAAAGRGAEKDFNKLLEFKGIDYTNCVMGVKPKGDDSELLLIANVSDEKAFEESLDDVTSVDVDEQDGYKTLKFSDASILVKDGLMFFGGNTGNSKVSPSSLISLVERWKEAADEQSLADWKKEKLEEPKLASVLLDANRLLSWIDKYESVPGLDEYKSNLKKQKVDYGLITFDIEGPTATLAIDMLDKEGQPSKIKGQGTLDTSMFNYITDQDQGMIAVALDMNQLRPQLGTQLRQAGASQSEIRLIENVASGLNGSLMAAAGVTDLDKAMSRNPQDGIHYVVVVACENNQARNTLDKIMAETGLQTQTDSQNHKYLAIPVDNEYDWYTDEYKITYANLYYKIEGHDIVFSNTPVTHAGNSKFRPSDYSGCYFVADAVLDKNSDLAREAGLDFGVRATAVSKGANFTLKITQTGTGGNFMTNIYKLLGSSM